MYLASLYHGLQGYRPRGRFKRRKLDVSRIFCVSYHGYIHVLRPFSSVWVSLLVIVPVVALVTVVCCICSFSLEFTDRFVHHQPLSNVFIIISSSIINLLIYLLFVIFLQQLDNLGEYRSSLSDVNAYMTQTETVISSKLDTTSRFDNPADELKTSKVSCTAHGPWVARLSWMRPKKRYAHSQSSDRFEPKE